MWNHQHSLLDLRDFLFGSLATYLCADALFLQNQPSNLIAASQTMAAQSETRKQMESIPRVKVQEPLRVRHAQGDFGGK